MRLGGKVLALLVLRFVDGDQIAAPRTTAGTKKLAFFFRRSLDPDASFYCPPKHLSTYVEDLCFNVNPLRKSRKTANEWCRKVSHRLAEIDGDDSWRSLLGSLAKYYRTLEMEDELVNLRYHLGRAVRLDNRSSEAPWVWESSRARLNDKYACKRKNASTQSAESGLSANQTSVCVELLDRDWQYESAMSSNSCVRMVDCDRIRYSICEWRGNSIQSFSLQLRLELVHSYISIPVVGLLFWTVWFVLYKCHSSWLDENIETQLATYLNQQRIIQILFSSESPSHAKLKVESL